MARQDTTFIQTESFPELGEKAAECFLEAYHSISDKRPVVTFPTGNTPTSFYEAMREKADKLDFIYLQLDEYIGLQPNSNRLFSRWISREILDPFEIPHEQRVTFRSDELFPEDEVARMQKWHDEYGPLDIAVVGIGVNGHIGFNEPPSDDKTHVRVVNLAPETLDLNDTYWKNEQKTPEKAYTLGMAEILKAKKIILLAYGISKASILKQAFEGELTPHIPASYLQNHPDVTIIADQDALSELKT